jgi:hypothetical protein
MVDAGGAESSIGVNAGTISRTRHTMGSPTETWMRIKGYPNK